MDALTGINAKLERANEHITNLSREIRIVDRRTYEFVAERDAERRPVYRITKLPTINPGILVIAGDVIQNLRTALEFLAYGLAIKGGATGKDLTRVEFPIKADAAKYKYEGPRKIKGFRQNAIQAFDAIEPYAGGKGDALWRLHCLSVIDKHRLLMTALICCGGVHLQSLVPDLFPEDIKSNPFLLLVTDKSFSPLKAGSVLYTGVTDEEMNENLEFRFDVMIDEAGVFERQLMIPALHRFAKLIGDIVVDFSPMLI